MKKTYASLLVLFALVAARLAFGHSVGQVQTTKFFAPETVQLLQDRVTGGLPAGFQTGDILTYIIQFTPIANGANVGVAGYITDYIPPGVEVVSAEIVDKDASGNYYPVAPKLPGGIDLGRGNRGARTFLAPFNTSAYDPTGLCAAGGYTNNCTGRLTELHADTGIFYSTDARTAVYPVLPTRILQGLNGYNINPTAAGQLNPIIGQAAATTHNLWDADQTNAFGSTAAAVAALAAPKSAAAALSNGTGIAPFFAASGVAGPQTGYQLDNTGQVGPWRRIYYPGSRIGDATLGPVNADNLSFTAVGGLPTNLGFVLSESNPLPAGTNAVRWAVGQLTVGQISYVRIKLRLTQPVPNEGIVNSSEVFGGDAASTDNGQDNIWRYHVPSVADNNSNLYVQKTPCVFDATATTCVPLPSPYHAGNTTITYQITYLNTGNAVQNNVVLQDIVPCQTTSGSTVRVGTVTGPLASLISVPYTATITTAGNCTAPQARHTITFPTIATLNPAAGGRLIINVRNTENTAGNAVVNTARLLSTQVPSAVTSNGVTFVGNATTPALTVAKSTPTPTSTAGGTAQYVIVVTNAGTGAATGIQVDDILPSNGTAAVNATTRFNYSSLSSVSSSGLTTATGLVVSTTTAALGGLTPYDTASGAANKVKVNFNFGATSSLAAGGRITITFVANVGTATNASSTPYYNNVVARGTAGNTYRIDSGDQAPVTISSPLQLSKVLECYFNAGNCIAPNGAGDIPPNARVRYRINYANASGGALSNAVLTDTLPCQTTSTTPNVTVNAVISGPIAPTGTMPYAVPGSLGGSCPNTRASFAFPATTLNAGQTGSLQIDVQLRSPANTTTVVVNDARLTATGASTVTSVVQNSVVTKAELLITKSVTPAVAPPGTTVTYAITVRNVGTTAAQTVTVYDILPTGTSTTADLTRRFRYINGSSVITGSLTSVVPTTRTTPTIAPYNLGPYISNQEQISWTFTGQTLAVGASTTIQFNALIGSNLPALPPPNYYNNIAVVTYFNAQQASSNAASANVSLVANLSISKTNATTTLVAGSTTAYTVTVANGGPSAANGAVVRDVSSAGLVCTSVTCAQTTGSATCPTALPLNNIVPRASTSFFGAGEAIPSFPGNSSVTFVVRCNVTATGTGL
jgi:uncharacterized repeat protein (TIGR01451 family)